jgi:hypothetical protein
MSQQSVEDLPLPDSVAGFKQFSDLWGPDGKLKETYLPLEQNIHPEDFKHAFQLGFVSTPWSRSKSQWDVKFHFKKCKGLTVMRRISETTRDWVQKVSPGARFPELVCRVDVSASPIFNDQIDVIMTGLPGEQIELCLETYFRTLKKVFG